MCPQMWTPHTNTHTLYHCALQAWRSWWSDIWIAAALTSSPFQSSPTSPLQGPKAFLRLQLHIQHHSTIIPLRSPTRLRNALVVFPSPKSGPAKLYRRDISGNRGRDKEVWALNPAFPSLGGVLISLLPSHFNSSSVLIVLEDKESKTMAHGCLTVAVDRRLCSPRLADLRSDLGLRKLWQRSYVAVCHWDAEHWSDICLPQTHTQAGGKRDKKDKRKPELHPCHYNDALGCVTLNFCVWAHVFHILSLVRWALRVSLVTHQPPGTAWQLQEKQETGSVKAWNSLSALCKHISLTHMELWFPNQYQISASTLSGGRLFGHKWSKTKLLQLIYAAYSFHRPQGLSR